MELRAHKKEFDPTDYKTHAYEEAYQKAKASILSNENHTSYTKEELLAFLEDIISFPLGRYLLEHKKLSGYWLDFLLSPPSHYVSVNSLEESFLWKFPSILGMRESVQNIKKIIEQNLQDGISIASFPCGLMSELLTLNYTRIKKFSLCGIDEDFQSIVLASELAEKNNLSSVVSFFQDHSLECTNLFHVIVNKVSLFDSQPERFYEHYYEKLYPKGLLLTYFSTFSPSFSSSSPWNPKSFKTHSSKLEEVIFQNVLGIRWENSCKTYDEVAENLNKFGFKNIEFIPSLSSTNVAVIAQKL